MKQYADKKILSNKCHMNKKYEVIYNHKIRKRMKNEYLLMTVKMRLLCCISKEVQYGNGKEESG